jgi:hypothetical protein
MPTLEPDGKPGSIAGVACGAALGRIVAKEESMSCDRIKPPCGMPFAIYIPQDKSAAAVVARHGFNRGE